MQNQMQIGIIISLKFIFVLEGDIIFIFHFVFVGLSDREKYINNAYKYFGYDYTV